MKIGTIGYDKETIFYSIIPNLSIRSCFHSSIYGNDIFVVLGSKYTKQKVRQIIRLHGLNFSLQ